MWYQITGPRFNVGLLVEAGIITKCAPYIGRFRNRPAKFLWAWCREHGYRVMELDTRRIVIGGKP